VSIRHAGARHHTTMVSVTPEAAGAACAAVLGGLDADTLEYLAGGVADVLEDGKSELIEYVVPMLEELCGGDEALATAKAEAGGVWMISKAGEASSHLPPAVSLCTATGEESASVFLTISKCKRRGTEGTAEGWEWMRQARGCPSTRTRPTVCYDETSPRVVCTHEHPP
jgi:hypothetical protein